MVGDLKQALIEAQNDPEIRYVVWAGAGRAFSAGYDMDLSRTDAPQTVWPAGLKADENISQKLNTTREHDRIDVDAYTRMWQLTKPIIAAVHGYCIGGASMYVMACHMIIAAEDAVFAQAEVRMQAETSFFWTLKIGHINALRYGLTGDHVDAQEMYRMGGVNAVVPVGEHVEAAFRLGERIALVAPETVKMNLQIVTRGLEMMGLRNALDMNAELQAMIHTSKREEWARPLDEAYDRGGLREYLQVRDGPFQPEPFGPRSEPRN
jgi:enoyl-CoA hydratase